MAPINFERLNIITDGDSALNDELINLFLDTSDKCLIELENNNEDRWKRSIHELKGASDNLGFIEISAVCLEAEKALLSSNEKRIIISRLRELIGEICDI